MASSTTFDRNRSQRGRKGARHIRDHSSCPVIKQETGPWWRLACVQML